MRSSKVRWVVAIVLVAAGLLLGAIATSVDAIGPPRSWRAVFGIEDDPPEEGVRAADGRLLLAPSLEGPGENELAVSLAVGLQRRHDGLTFGEFARARMSRECPASPSSSMRFDRVWLGGDARYSIQMAPGGGCDGAVVAEVDWRNGEVVTPSPGNRWGRTVPWLDDFRSGDEP